MILTRPCNPLQNRAKVKDIHLHLIAGQCDLK
jgi:hypothetical protein